VAGDFNRKAVACGLSTIALRMRTVSSPHHRGAACRFW
jgi:hypothetical protein